MKGKRGPVIASQTVEILLVDDNPSDVQLTLYALRENHFAGQVHVAQDGEEALQYLFGDVSASPPAQLPRPRVVLLDLKMPKVGGLEVLEKVKSDPRTRGIPIVVLTSSNQDRDILQSYDLGVNSYIVKPLDLAEFTRAIGAVSQYWLQLNQAPLH